MSYLSLHDYTRDICENLSTPVKFFHGRKEVLFEYEQDPTLPTVWALPFQSSGSFTEDGYQVNRTFTMNLIFYRHDEPGSEVDQNNQSISAEMSVLSESDALAEEFVRLFNYNTINDALELASDKLIINGFSTDNVIKDNQYYLTGTLLNMTVTVPDDFNYCNTTSATSLTYSNNLQTIDEAGDWDNMVPTLTPSDATGSFSFSSGGAGLAINSSTGVITVSDFSVMANGQNSAIVSWIGSGTYLGSSLVYQVLFSKIPIVSANTVEGLTYSNDDQELYYPTSVFNTMVPTVDPCNATGTYSKTDTTPGITLDTSTGLITVDYSTLPAGVYNFNVTFTGAGSFTGSASYPVTISKFTIWTPSNLTDFSTNVHGWWDWSDSGNTVVDDRITVVIGKHDGGQDLTDTPAYGGMFKEIVNGLNAGGCYGKSMGLAPGEIADIAQTVNVFVLLKPNPSANGSLYTLNRTSPVTRYILAFSGASKSLQIALANTVVSSALTNQQVINIMGDFSLHRVLHNGSSSLVEIDAGETYSLSLSTWPTSDFPIGTYGIAFGSGSYDSAIDAISAIYCECLITGPLTSDEVDLVVGYMENKWGTNDRLSDSHPYRYAPPVL